jgi:hypothetical protein
VRTLLCRGLGSVGRCRFLGSCSLRLELLLQGRPVAADGGSLRLAAFHFGPRGSSSCAASACRRWQQGGCAFSWRLLLLRARLLLGRLLLGRLLLVMLLLFLARPLLLCQRWLLLRLCRLLQRVPLPCCLLLLLWPRRRLRC